MNSLKDFEYFRVIENGWNCNTESWEVYVSVVDLWGREEEQVFDENEL
ncbi:MAG: hypothetical protein JXB23_14430 [Candidatus Aminicenantes bacterium]|nr:hypothetical protein [Candidatus Aminicenantes bacterium]